MFLTSGFDKLQYNPPLIEGTGSNPKTYNFGTGGTPSLITIDKNSRIGWGWYIIDYSASTSSSLIAFKYERFIASPWSQKYPTTSYSDHNSGFVGFNINKHLSNPPNPIDAEIVNPTETTASDSFPDLSLVNHPTKVPFSFPIGGEYEVGLVFYYRLHSKLVHKLITPLQFEVQAIYPGLEEAIYFRVNNPSPGAFEEDKDYTFNCTTWIDYGTPVGSPLEPDLSEKHSGVLPESVKYHWFVNRWDDSNATVVKIHPSPLATPPWTLLTNTNTTVSPFTYIFPTPLNFTDEYIVGISFEWEEIHWKPVYSDSGDPNTLGNNTNIPGASNKHHIIRYEIDPAYPINGTIIRSCREEKGTGPVDAKIHNNPNPPLQLIRDGTSPVTFTVEDMTPPEIMFLDQTPVDTVAPNYNGTTGDRITIRVKIRDNHPQFIMKTPPPGPFFGAPLLIWEFQPEGYGTPCFMSKSLMTYEPPPFTTAVESPGSWDDTFIPPSLLSSTSNLVSFSKFEPAWFTYKIKITLPFAFRSSKSVDPTIKFPILRFSVHVQDAAGFTNEGINYTYLDDDRIDHDYYPGEDLNMLPISALEIFSTNFGQFHDPSNGTVSIDDNDQPALAIRIEPLGIFAALAYRHNIYHISTNDLWDPLAIDNSSINFNTTNIMYTELVHPYDPAIMSSYVPHPKVNSFSEDLKFNIYIEFYDNCIWEGTAPDSGVLYTGADNILPNNDIGNAYFKVFDATDATGTSGVGQTALPISDVVTNPVYNASIFSGGMGEAVTTLNNLYFQWMFYDANDHNDDGYPDQDWTPPPAPPAPPGTPPRDPSAPEFYFDVGCQDKAGNKRRLKLRFPIKPIPVFIHSLEQKTHILKRK